MHLKPIFWKRTHRLHQTAQDLCHKEKVKSSWGFSEVSSTHQFYKTPPWMTCSVLPLPRCFASSPWIMPLLSNTSFPSTPFLASSCSWISALMSVPIRKIFLALQPAAPLDFSHLVPCSSTSGSLYPSRCSCSSVCLPQHFARRYLNCPLVLDLSKEWQVCMLILSCLLLTMMTSYGKLIKSIDASSLYK